MTIPAVHELKCAPAAFDAIASGEKTFEVRKNDRFFQRGDLVRLLRLYNAPLVGNFVETDHEGKPKHVLEFEIGWMLQGGQYGIEPGYCVFTLVPLAALNEARK